MQKITPCLWFDHNAEEAVNFYLSAFKNGRILTTTRYPEAGKEIHGMEAGTVLTVEFEIEGYKFLALNGGPAFKFTPAISFTVNCSSKEEVEELWGKLSEGGQALMPLDSYPFSERYGWIQDKYGLSWQIILPKEPQSSKIFPSIMYTGPVAGKAEEAINFYLSVFPDSQMGQLHRYGPGQEHDPENHVMYADFILAGQKFSAMDSGYSHEFNFNEAVSLLINCQDQEEVDYFWEKLSAVPEAEQCGWLKDKYGLSWQVAPEEMDRLLNDPDKDKAGRAMEAMLKMKKIDIEEIRRAYEGV